MTTDIQEKRDKAGISDLVARYGSSSATAWLEFSRYKIWRPEVPIPESDFLPVQGYMVKDKYIFAWGNPLVSSPAALLPTAHAFVKFAQEELGLHPIWACVDRDMEEVLSGPEFEWNTVSCIYEDYIDPAHLLDLTSPEAKGQEGQHVVKDLKKNLNRAEKYDVRIREVRGDQWTPEARQAVEDGIEEWRSRRTGIQIASTTVQPWLDEQHRRYWIAVESDEKIVGILILTPIKAHSWQIKNAISFPKAPKGTSEALIYYALKDLHAEDASFASQSPPPATQLTEKLKRELDSSPTPSQSSASSTAAQAPLSSHDSSPSPSFDVVSPASDTGLSGALTPRGSVRSLGAPSTLEDEGRVAVTFGISAAPDLEPVSNLGGWKVKALSKTYKKVASSAKLINRGEFRRKFNSEHQSMYVCYPADGFGLDGVNALFKLLRK